MTWHSLKHGEQRLSELESDGVIQADPVELERAGTNWSELERTGADWRPIYVKEINPQDEDVCDGVMCECRFLIKTIISIIIILTYYYNYYFIPGSKVFEYFFQLYTGSIVHYYV